MLVNILAVLELYIIKYQVTQKSNIKIALTNLVRRHSVTKLQPVNVESEKPLHLKPKRVQFWKACHYTCCGMFVYTLLFIACSKLRHVILP